MHNRGECGGQEGSGIKLNGIRTLPSSVEKFGECPGPGPQAKVKGPMAWTKRQC